jgi:serine/threonine protein kinase/TolA-binding protein
MLGRTVGHYRIVERLGAGGMGVVYRGEDLRLGRAVALKFLPTDMTTSRSAIDRFEREARTASALNHPNICTIFAIEEHEGQRFIVMELLDGQALTEVIGGRPMPVDTVIDFAIQIADAIDTAHSQGILHRDIKPANIFVTRRGRVKVLDFGLAKIAPLMGREPDASDSHPTMADILVTTQGVALGTVAYMSPEQARGEVLDVRTDLFSFGIVLYEMVTGQQAFPGRTAAVVFDSILNRTPPPASLLAELPPDLERILTRALDKDRSARYQSAAELLSDLERLKRERGSGRTTASGATPIQSGATSIAPRPVSSEAVPIAAAPSTELDPFEDAPTMLGPAPSRPAAASSSAAPISAAMSTPAAATASGTVPVPLMPPVAAPPLASSPVAEAVSPAPMPLTAPPPAATPAVIKPKGAQPVVSGRSRSRGLVASGLALLAVAGVGSAAYVWKARQPADAVSSAPSDATDESVVPPPAPPPPPAVVDASLPPVPLPSEAESSAAIAVAPDPNARRAGRKPLPPPPAATPLASSAIVPVLPKSSPQKDPAVMLLDAAQSKLGARLTDQAIGDLQAIIHEYPASSAAPPALLLLARINDQQGRLDEAIAACEQLRARYGSSASSADATFMLAQLVQRSKRPDRMRTARTLLGEIPVKFPDSSLGPRALAAKALIEIRERLKDSDPEFGNVPASFTSDRLLVSKYPDAPEAELAWWRAGQEYENRKKYDPAARCFENLGTRFPKTSFDAWWRAGELYDKRLKNDDLARAAYSKVPQSSRNYKEAQKRAGRK